MLQANTPSVSMGAGGVACSLYGDLPAPKAPEDSEVSTMAVTTKREGEGDGDADNGSSKKRARTKDTSDAAAAGGADELELKKGGGKRIILFCFS